MGQIITVQQIASILICGAVVFSSSAFAVEKYYKWIDHNGTMQYTQNPPPANARKVLKSVQVSTHIPVDVRNRSVAEPSTANAAPSVVDNSTPTAATPDQPATFNNDSVAPSNK